MTEARDAVLESELLEMIPQLRAYARALTRDRNDADDLLQETLMKALAHIGSFQRGTSLRAWLFTIMRNTFFTNLKKRRREAPGAEDCVSGLLSVEADHERHESSRDMMAAIQRLPVHYREILILVVMLGESYERAAEICCCAVGTVKSRLNRARRIIMEELGPETLES